MKVSVGKTKLTKDNRSHGDEVSRRVLAESRKVSDNGYLVGEDGCELIRRMGLTDDALRRKKVQSVVGRDGDVTGNWEALEVFEAEGGRWVAANLGRTFVSKNAVHNLFAAVPAQGLGIGTVMQLGGGAYMVNERGDRFPLRRVGKQLRFEALMLDRSGRQNKVEFVHDSGAAANVLRFDVGATWSQRGDGVVYMGGYTGGQNKLTGGNDLRVFLRADDTVNNTVESCAEARDGCTMSDVLAQVALEEGSAPGRETGECVAEVGDEEPNDGQLDWEQDDTGIEEWLGDMSSEQKKRVLGRLASAKAVVVAIGGAGNRFNQDVDDEGSGGERMTKALGRQMGLLRRMRNMERAAEI